MGPKKDKSAMDPQSSKDPKGSRGAPKIDAETEEKIYQWVKRAMENRTEEDVKWEEDNFPGIDTLEEARAAFRAQIWGASEDGGDPEEQQPKKKGKGKAPIQSENGEGEEEQQPKEKGKGRAPTPSDRTKKGQVSMPTFKSATGRLVPGENFFSSKEQEYLMAQMAGHIVHVEGLICINAEEQPEMARAFEALAAAHGWKPILPVRVGHVEFRAVWDLDFTLSVAAYGGFFELLMASDPESSMSKVELESREKPCCEIQLGPKHAPHFHFVQAYLHTNLGSDTLLQAIWTIPSRYGRAECIIRNLVYVGNLVGDSEEFAYLNFYVNEMWDALCTWGFCHREIDIEADGHKVDLLFHNREQFRALYAAAHGTSLRFFAIETVERAFVNAAHHAAATLPEWIEEDFLNHTDPDTAMFRDDLRELRDLSLRRHRATTLTLPWPKYYIPRPDLAVSKPFNPLPERYLLPPNGDLELKAQPWLARAGLIPSAKEVRNSIEALTKTLGENGIPPPNR